MKSMSFKIILLFLSLEFTVVEKVGGNEY